MITDGPHPHLRTIAVNPHIQTVRADAGATWELVDRATCAHGLIVPAASGPGEGIAGPTLADDPIEPSRPHGPTRESLLEVTLARPDGGVVRAAEIEALELLDAIGRSAPVEGVVTSLLFRAVAC